jgi:hypothetical protein
MTNYAWHFLAVSDGSPILRDGRRLPAANEWLSHDGPISICSSGLHASYKALDAVHYAPGNYVTLCEVDGDIVEQEDKLVCRKRRVVFGYDAEQVLRLFSREQALSVAHLWDMPQIVREYLESGDESKRAAAYAAWYATNAAAWDAASAAARAAARAAASDAAWSARSAASATASATAWYAASDAASYAANEMLESMLFAEALRQGLWE